MQRLKKINSITTEDILMSTPINRQTNAEGASGAQQMAHSTGNISNNKKWQALLSTGVGGYAGATTCFPFESIKKKLESGQLKTLFSRELFPELHPQEIMRGSVAFSLAVGSNAATMIVVNRLLHSLQGYDHNSKAQEIGAAVLSGGVASIFSTVVENTLMDQQLRGVSLQRSVSSLGKQGTTRFYIGFPELFLRECGFGTFMIVIMPTATKKVRDLTHNEALAQGAGLFVGIGGALGTQPFDVMATGKQKAACNGKRISTSQVAREIYKKQGVLGFWSGGIPRAGLFVGCATFIPLFTKKIEEWFKNIERKY
jgi:hypothetical protein